MKSLWPIVFRHKGFDIRPSVSYQELGNAADHLYEERFIDIDSGGHSWLEVPRILLIKLGIELKITPYSYQKGSMVYLEEDTDWGTFDKAMKDAGHKYAYTKLDYSMSPYDWDLPIYKFDTFCPKAKVSYDFPSDAKEWTDVIGPYGFTRAHMAAEAGKLPNPFNQWHLTANYGETVAHIAVQKHCLSAEFDQWGLKNGRGETVAQYAEQYDTLPAGITDWRDLLPEEHEDTVTVSPGG
jgi:hypothetical protein